MKLFGKPLLQRGDTIVEVLISLLVISAILVGAFVLSQTSSRNVRDSQEHAEALGLLQGQVELLRTAAGVEGALSGIAQDSAFCMNGQARPVGTSDTACQQSNLYNLSIVDLGQGTDVQTNKFRLTVTWDRLGGGTNQESLVYRVAVQ